MATTEGCATIPTDRTVDRVFTLIRIVDLSEEALTPPLIVAGACITKQCLNGGVCDIVRHIPQVKQLRTAVAYCQFEASQTAQAVVAVLECRIVTQVMTGGELERLALVVADIVTFVASKLGSIIATPNPCHGLEFAGTVLVVAGIEDIELYVAHIVQTMLIICLAKQFVFYTELRRQVILLLIPPSIHGTGNGVTVHEHVPKVIRCHSAIILQPTSSGSGISSGQRQHIEIVAGRVTLCIVLIYAHVRHSIVCTRQNVVTIVLVVGRKGQVDVTLELDAVTDPIIQCRRTGETVKFLSDDRTGTLIVVGTDTESSIVTTTRESNCELMFLTKLLYLLHPVGIMTVMIIYIR